MTATDRLQIPKITLKEWKNINFEMKSQQIGTNAAVLWLSKKQILINVPNNVTQELPSRGAKVSALVITNLEMRYLSGLTMFLWQVVWAFKGTF